MINTKEKYIDLMERALSAYSEQHIHRYLEDVKRDGLKEHGFPRLTANIGNLIAHGRVLSLKKVFLEMMDLCCRSIPVYHAGNGFSVREVVNCISELENSMAVDAADIARWKGYLAEIDPNVCYEIYATTPTDRVKNWALFAGVSEYFRKEMGLGGSDEWIDTQLASQLQWLDENGMYMDGEGKVHHPLTYDLVSRALLAMLLHGGYIGVHYSAINSALRRAGLATLMMQSPNGETPFGGRSNQFVHNEAWLAVVLEYEANRYWKSGDRALAIRFKSAAYRAIGSCERWLESDPIYHVKNRFSTESRYGCEVYAYFDKYMITVASILHAAYMISDESIPVSNEPDIEPTVFETSEHFHKLFLKSGGYGLEFELNADGHYDACGLGRVHREGAPSAICLSAPCPPSPTYAVNIEPSAVSICPGVLIDDEWLFAVNCDTGCDVVDTFIAQGQVGARICVRFSNGVSVISKYTVSAEGVRIESATDGDIAFLLPVFYFDGETHPEINTDGGALIVQYKGYRCTYLTEGRIIDSGKIAPNRNGHYKVFYAICKNTMDIWIKIDKA